MQMRTATPEDLQFIYATLVADRNIVLVRSVSQPRQKPYPLLEICKGPMFLDEEGLHAMSLEDEPTVLRITKDFLPLSTFPHVVELKKGEGDWYAPEFGSVILLVPDTK